MLKIIKLFFLCDVLLEILEDRQIWYNPQKPYVHTDVSEKLSLEI